MATDYPHATFIGIDPGAVFPADVYPNNCRFYTCDLNNTVTFFPPQRRDVNKPFDFIHLRCVLTTMAPDSWPALMAELTQKLYHHTGWLEIVECTGVVRREGSQPTPGPATRLLEQWLRRLYHYELDWFNADPNKMLEEYLRAALSMHQLIDTRVKRVSIPLHLSSKINKKKPAVLLEWHKMRDIALTQLHGTYLRTARAAMNLGWTEADAMLVVEQWWQEERERQSGWLDVLVACGRRAAV